MAAWLKLVAADFVTVAVRHIEAAGTEQPQDAAVTVAELGAAECAAELVVAAGTGAVAGPEVAVVAAAKPGDAYESAAETEDVAEFWDAAGTVAVAKPEDVVVAAAETEEAAESGDVVVAAAEPGSGCWADPMDLGSRRALYPAAGESRPEKPGKLGVERNSDPEAAVAAEFATGSASCVPRRNHRRVW